MTDQVTIMHEIAKRIADEGMDRALDRAERTVPKWGDLALDYIRRFAMKNMRFAGYMVAKSAHLDPNFPRPENDKAWGVPIRRAIKKGYIAHDGTTKDPYRHGNPIPVWKSLIYGQGG